MENLDNHHTYTDNIGLYHHRRQWISNKFFGLDETAICKVGEEITDKDVTFYRTRIKELIFSSDNHKDMDMETRKRVWNHLVLSEGASAIAGEMLNHSGYNFNINELRIAALSHDLARACGYNSPLRNDLLNGILLKDLGVKQEVLNKIHSIDWLINDKEGFFGKEKENYRLDLTELIKTEKVKPEQLVLKLADSLGKFNDKGKIQNSDYLLDNYSLWLDKTQKQLRDGHKLTPSEQKFLRNILEYAGRDKVLIRETQNWFNSFDKQQMGNNSELSNEFYLISQLEVELPKMDLVR